MIQVLKADRQRRALRCLRAVIPPGEKFRAVRGTGWREDWRVCICVEKKKRAAL